MNTTSEYVRQELRAVVGARTGGRPGSQGSSQHQQVQQQQQQMAMSPMGIGQMNPMGLTNLNTGQMGGMMQSSIMQSPSDLDALGLGFDTHGMFLILLNLYIVCCCFHIFSISHILPALINNIRIKLDALTKCVSAGNIIELSNI